MNLSRAVLVLSSIGVTACAGGQRPATTQDYTRQVVRASDESDCATARAHLEVIASRNPAMHAALLRRPAVHRCATLELRPPVVPTDRPSAQPQPVAEPKGPKSLAAATVLSLGGTVLAAALTMSFLHDDADELQVLCTALAVTFAPSAGHWYTNDFWTHGITLRALGVATALGSTIAAFAKEDGDLLVAGGGLGLGIAAMGVVLDLVTLPGAVRDYNRRAAGWTVSPAGFDGAGTVAPGLVLRTDF